MQTREMSTPRQFSASRKLLGPGIILIASLVLSVAVARTALFYHVDSWFADAMHGFTAPSVQFDDVLIVDMNESSMAALAPQLGSWPYKRDVFALVTEHLDALGARSVIFALDFSDEREGDEAFAGVLAKSAGVWMAAQGRGYEDPDRAYESQLGELAWQPAEAVPAKSWRGFRLPNRVLTLPGRRLAGAAVVSVEADADGILRRVPLMHKSGNHYLPSLPLASLFAPETRPVIKRHGSVLQVGSRSWPIDDDGNVYLRVPANLDMFQVVAFDQVVRSAQGTDRQPLDESLVRGRNVFIGSTAAVLGEYTHVPTHGRVAGLDMLALAHANLSYNLVLAPRSNLWLVIFCLLGAVLPLMIVNYRPLPEWLIPVTFTLGVLVIAAIHIGFLKYLGRQSALLFPLLFSSLTLLGQMVLRVRALQEERRRYYLEKLAADDASALKSQFLSHMTHELRTPLTAIMGYNKLLADPDLNDQERTAQVRIIDKNCQHLLSLINNLLDQAKIEAGQMLLDVGSVPVEGLMNSVMDTLHPIADQKGLEVRCNLSANVPSGIRVDELRIRQVLVNLGGNAIKFASQGGVTFEVDWKQGWLKIDVMDTGPGMSREALARIFDAFHQADVTVARIHGGTGLGLSISRNLARLMGGDISVSSMPGQGSTFTVQIPAEAIEFPNRRADQAVSGAREEPVRGRILVADDTEDLRHLLSLYLKKMGMEVLLAVNGEEAVEIAASKKPDLIFMDMQMPVMDGLEAVRTLRENGYAGEILALTAQSDRDRIEATLKAGCDGYVEKPVSQDRLREIVQRRLSAVRSESGENVNKLPDAGN